MAWLVSPATTGCSTRQANGEDSSKPWIVGRRGSGSTGTSHPQQWDVEVDPIETDRVYATSFYDGRVESLAGINVSADGGNTWVHPITATPPPNFNCSVVRRREPSAFGVSIDPRNPANAYVGTNCGLARTADRGSTWTFVDPTPNDCSTTPTLGV
jgi:photosystem II stability/assembly factor-like uncharacterized protein